MNSFFIDQNRPMKKEPVNRDVGLVDRGLLYPMSSLV